MKTSVACNAWTENRGRGLFHTHRLKLFSRGTFVAALIPVLLNLLTTNVFADLASFDRVDVSVIAPGRIEAIPVTSAWIWDPFPRGVFWESDIILSDGIVNGFADTDPVARKGDPVENTQPGRTWKPDPDREAAIKQNQILGVPLDQFSGSFDHYEADSKRGYISAYGSFSMKFKATAVAPIAGDKVDITLTFKTPKQHGNAGIESVVYAHTYNGMGPITPLLNPAWEPYNPLKGPRHEILHGNDFKKLNDEIYVHVAVRVWASPLPLGPVPPPAPVIPEPATWLLGLTGLAAVIGTQAWKSRQRMMRS